MSNMSRNQNITPDDLNDPKVIDSITLTNDEKKIGMTKFLIFSAIAVLIFFIPIQYQGKQNILFGIIYNSIVKFLGLPGFWYVCIVIVLNGFASIYGKYLSKPGTKLHEYYKNDSIIHPILYLTSAIFMFMYCLHITIPSINLPEIIVGKEIAGVVVPDIVIGVAWIIPVGAFFVPFLLNYGSIDFVGVLLEPLMRPLFKVPGKSAVDATASFVGSTSMSIIITSRLFKNLTYTKKEATIIATSFSAVSVGYAFVVMQTAAVEQYFLPIYFLSFLLAFIVAFFVVRIPPINKMDNIYYNGKKQSVEDFKNEPKYGKGMLRKGIDRATKRAFYSEKLSKSIVESVIDGFKVLPKVVSLLCVIGILSMIVAKNTPVFEWLGYLFLPILNLCQVPDASSIAACMPVGITEMFIPTLIIADKVDILSEAARAFVVMVSTVQVIFFAESIVVIKSTGIPVSMKQLIILFIQRTLIAIPFASLFVHLLF